ncbi:MAG TPA: alpha-amylase family glycosyl hydrolase [Polyangia bacterium]|jgi:glycosidase
MTTPASARHAALPAVLALLLAACGAAAPAAAPRIALDGVDGDVWAWQRRVTGTADPAACAEVRVGGPAGEVTATRTGGEFAATVPLGEGENTLHAVCGDGHGGESRSAALTYRVPLAARPTARIRVAVADDGVALDAGDSGPGPFGAPLVRHAWSVRPGNPEELRLATGAPLAGAAGPRVVVAAPVADGEYYLRLEVADELGGTDVSETFFRVVHGAALPVDLDTESAAWIEGAVVYGVYPPLYGERPLSGVTARLDDLTDLGVTALWLSPLFPAPGKDFGYAVTDYFGVRPEYGTPDELRELITQAHARGLRVVLDFVPNHTSAEHPYFQAAEAFGPASPQYDYYARDERGAATHYYDWTNLPNLNYDHPEVRRFMTEAFASWVRDYGVDGFRVDAAWGVIERAPGYFAEWRRELLRLKPDLLLLAEATARSPAPFRGGFAVAYDWTAEPGHWAWEQVFGKPDTTARLHAALTNDGAGAPADALVLRFLNNNDTGARFITTYGRDLLVPASTLLLTLPGLPCLYTGDEVGAELEPYEEPAPLTFADPWDLRDLHRRLIAARRDTPALRSRSFVPVPATPAAGVYAYLRPGDTPVLVALSFAAATTTATLTLPAAYADAFAGDLRDLVTGEAVTLGPGVTLPLGPYAARVLAPR